ncbi:MAG: 50S ribosomal protein L7/L12 [Alphaproteobacteria bacterium]|nr:50S ribosomal protein L7/L12 [Alphaproteobacteria bacterium]
MATQADVVDYIKNLKLSEVKDLIAILEEELGVEASAPVMMGAMPAGAGGAAAAVEEEEPTEFNVVLTNFGGNKIAVIKAIRALTGLGLKEAKELVEGVPSVIKEQVDKEAADGVAAQLKEAGAEVEIKPVG